MQILFVQSVNFPGQIGPVQTSTQAVSELVFRDLDTGTFINTVSFPGLPLAPLLDQPEFPAKEIV